MIYGLILNIELRKNNGRAYGYVGFLYEEGEFLTRSLSKAQEYYKKGAELGDWDSLLKLK